MERTLDATIADDLLSRINPSTQADRLSNAVRACNMGSKQAERVILRGLELVAKEAKEKKEEK